MNSQTFSDIFVRCARPVAALFAGIFLISAVRAQPVAGGTDNRYLLVFDTSSAMKGRVPATQNAVERLFLSMMNGQLQPGDTIGVWAFDRKLRAGDVPLQHWMPQNAATIASGITNFVKRQRYSRSARFNVVMPEINNLVQNSQRLTLLIFCDGSDEITGTPFDDAINSILSQNKNALRKTDQTFIVVLRTQFGQYIGYTVNSSAIGVNFPTFPPLSPPPQPVVPVESKKPVPQSAVTTQPLVIIGTNVSTNLIPLAPPKTVIPGPPPAKVESNPPPPAESLSSPTNAVPPPAAKAQTNILVPPEDNGGLSRNGALAIGAALLVTAGVLVVFVFYHSRKTGRGSLITRSMKKD